MKRSVMKTHVVYFIINPNKELKNELDVITTHYQCLIDPILSTTLDQTNSLNRKED